MVFTKNPFKSKKLSKKLGLVCVLEKNLGNSRFVITRVPLLSPPGVTQFFLPFRKKGCSSLYKWRCLKFCQFPPTQIDRRLLSMVSMVYITYKTG